MKMTQDMLALIMCGGKGERIKEFCSDKAMLKYDNKPLIEHVIISLKKSRQFKRIYAATSQNCKVTFNFLKEHDYYRTGFLQLIETTGINYSTDIILVLEKLKPSIVFVVPSDMPLISSELVKRITSSWKRNRQCLSIVMDKEFPIQLGLFPTLTIKRGNKEFFHTGITIFDSSKIKKGTIIKEQYVKMNNERLAFNINTKKDFFLLRSRHINQMY